MVSPDVYNTLSVTAFIPLVNPGPTAITIDGATAAVIANKSRSFTDTTASFKQYDSANNTLRKILLGTVDEMFVRSLQTKYVGYLNVSTCDILDHLYSEYARILASDLQNIDVALKISYNPNQPIQSLNALNYAATGNTPYSPSQVVVTAFQLLFTTGMFLDNFKTWKRKPDANKTWAIFKTYFS